MRRLLAPVLVALAAAGCGGSAKPRVVTVQPRLPRALAQDWQQQADAVSAALAANDGCTARAKAVALQQSVIRAIDARRIPRRFDETLQGAANELVDGITCTPPPPVTVAVTPAPAPPGHGDGHGHGKGHGHGHDKHGEGEG